jgi:hypothetical protein
MVTSGKRRKSRRAGFLTVVLPPHHGGDPVETVVLTPRHGGDPPATPLPMLPET